MAEWISGQELGRRLGISETMVRKHRISGLFRTRDGKYDFEASKQAFDMNRDPDAVLKGIAGGQAVTGSQNEPSTPAPSTLAKVRTIAASIDAKKRSLELQRLEGSIIGKDEAKAACLAVVHEIKTRFEGLPAAAAPVVHAAPTVAEAEQLLRGMVRAVLVEVAKLGDVVDEISQQ